MTNLSNPWITRSAEPALEPDEHDAYVIEEGQPAPATGPTTPQAGVPVPAREDRLPVREVWEAPSLWVLGTHGGAGESVLAGLVPSWGAADHTWPRPVGGSDAPVLLVARTHLRGLLSARAAATQWAAGAVPHADVVGLVLIADAPGRLPRPLRELSQVVSGGVPRTWTVPWSETWRLGESPTLADAPRAARQMVDELQSIIPTPRATGAF